MVDKVTLFIFAAVFLGSLFTEWTPVVFVVAAAVVGVLTEWIGGKRE